VFNEKCILSAPEAWVNAMAVAMTTRCTQQVDSGMATVDDAAELTVLRRLQCRNAWCWTNADCLIFSQWLLLFTSV